MRDGYALANAAASFIGVRFQLHGRDPAHGLDCIGLLHASLRAIGCDAVAPTGYRLRNGSLDQWSHLVSRNGLFAVEDDVVSGDVLLIAPGPQQMHILIAENTKDDGQPESVIHAHAGLRRVVRQPITDPPSMLAHLRLDPNAEDT